MKATRNRLRVCVSLLCLVLAFIWGNSCLPAEYSRAFSNWVRNMLAPLFGWPEVLPDAVGGPSVLRKVAHFTEFCGLGIVLSWLMHMLRSKKWEVFLFALGAGVLAACIDEAIQFFVPGRGPGWLEVGIDTMGLTLGIAILSAIASIIHGKTKTLEENKL